MLLSTLLQGMTPIPAEADRSISLIKLDSRLVHSNDLFIAIKGTQVDGRQYIHAAVENGAAAVLVEADGENESVSFYGHVPLIPIVNLSHFVSEIAARFYDYPSRKLHMLGVTGTNGKTSVTHFFAQAMAALDERCGMIGTLGSGFYCSLGEAGLTTPDPISLQALLADFLRHNANSVAMEVSSHSIDQGRANAVAFELGVFTNLSQDHLDYHGTMAAYAAVKRHFLADMVKTAIINIDDDYGRQWANELADAKPVYVYSASGKSLPGDLPAVIVRQVHLGLDGMRAELDTPWGECVLRLPLIGMFNLSNVLAVLTALCASGQPLEKVLPALHKLSPVPGRMQTLGGIDAPLVVVDYAHTPDALDKVLEALRLHVEQKLICVFGCGGDRDQGKRPLMARVVEKWADHVILTDDNPRNENPQAIADQVMQGFVYPERVQIELDRSKAIQKSIQYATEGDCVLIAGKGAEKYQQIGDKKYPFDDVKEVNNYLRTVTVSSSL